MEKNVTLSASSQTEVNFQSVANSLQTAVAKMAQKVMAPLEWLRSYYSNICEKQLTLGQTGTLVSAQLAFIATAFKKVDFPEALDPVTSTPCSVRMLFFTGSERSG